VPQSLDGNQRSRKEVIKKLICLTKEARRHCRGPSILAARSTGRGASVWQPFCRNRVVGWAARNPSVRLRERSAIAARHSLVPMVWTAMGYCLLSSMIPGAQKPPFSIVDHRGAEQRSLSAHRTDSDNRPLLPASQWEMRIVSVSCPSPGGRQAAPVFRQSPARSPFVPDRSFSRSEARLPRSCRNGISCPTFCGDWGSSIKTPPIALAWSGRLIVAPALVHRFVRILSGQGGNRSV
jgi:hypothetical protein